MRPPSREARRRRRRALLGLVTLTALVVGGVLLVDTVRGPGRRAAPRADMGDQSDVAALGQAVEAGIGDAPGGRPGGEPGTTCAPETRATYGRGLGSMVYAARLRWQGAPAVALAYRAREPAGGRLDHRIFVVSQEGCQLLVAQSL